MTENKNHIQNRTQYFEKVNFIPDTEHGGDIYKLAEKIKIEGRRIMDFSASINPLGVSKRVKAEIRKHLKNLHNYPDPEANKLTKFLAQYHGIDPETILCGNGSTELIYLIARALRPKGVLMPAPTFSEYERACRINSEPKIIYYELRKDNGFKINADDFINHMGGCDIAFLCNPNNPTGNLLKRDLVTKIAHKAEELRCYLIIDEAFIDFSSGYSLIKETASNPFLIVLRSLTKFYALAGLRIGYGVFPEHLIRTLKEHKEPWTVNSLAQKAAITALKDRVYIDETFRLINDEKRFLEKNFKKIGIEFFRSDANFYLLKIDNADEICQRLRKKGILVRNCANFRGIDNTYIRVAVKLHRENTSLLKSLAEMLWISR